MDKELIKYAWSFYAPGELYGDIFDNKLKKVEVVICTELVKLYFIEKNMYYEGTSLEREITRDLILKLFNYPPTRTHPFDFLDFDLEYDQLVNEIIDWYENQST
jgi:hypothetical protein